MTSKLVVIINSLKVPKIKKILIYQISCTKLEVPPEPPWLGGYTPRSLFSLSSVLKWICWTSPPQKKFLGTPLLATPNTSYNFHRQAPHWPALIRSDVAVSCHAVTDNHKILTSRRFVHPVTPSCSHELSWKLVTRLSSSKTRLTVLWSY